MTLKPTMYPIEYTKNGRLSIVHFKDLNTNITRDPHAGDVFRISVFRWPIKTYEAGLSQVILYGGAAWIVYETNHLEGHTTLLFCSDVWLNLNAAIEQFKTAVKCEIEAFLDILQGAFK